MYAIRRIQKVQNGAVIVELPTDFPADRVEVIVLPAEDETNAWVGTGSETSSAGATGRADQASDPLLGTSTGGTAVNWD